MIRALAVAIMRGTLLLLAFLLAGDVYILLLFRLLI
jgi:hypothetical protein